MLFVPSQSPPRAACLRVFLLNIRPVPFPIRVMVKVDCTTITAR